MRKIALATALLALGYAPAIADDVPRLQDTSEATPFPLTAEEIRDAHTCSLGTMLVICAGEKRISTGLIIATQLQGRFVPNWWEPAELRDPHKNPIGTAPISATTFEAVLTLSQKDPEWHNTYYVVDDAQLRDIVARALQDPGYDPTK